MQKQCCVVLSTITKLVEIQRELNPSLVTNVGIRSERILVTMRCWTSQHCQQEFTARCGQRRVSASFCTMLYRWVEALR